MKILKETFKYQVNNFTNISIPIVIEIAISIKIFAYYFAVAISLNKYYQKSLMHIYKQSTDFSQRRVILIKTGPTIYLLAKIQ